MWFVQSSPVRESYSTERHFHIAPSVASARCVDEVFVLNKKTGRYYKLDDISTELWPLLRTPISLPDILESLGEVFEMPPRELTDDIVALLRRLMEYGIVTSRE